jgi:hypothetical protein
VQKNVEFDALSNEGITSFLLHHSIGLTVLVLLHAFITPQGEKMGLYTLHLADRAFIYSQGAHGERQENQRHRDRRIGLYIECSGSKTGIAQYML